jgi:chemotaxis protein CheX
MKAYVVQAFVGAAREVLAQEMGGPVEPQRIVLQGGPYETKDVTVIIGIAQDIEGAIILSMARDTALTYVSGVMGEERTALDELAQSGVGELANVIAGRASSLLGDRGYRTLLSPPTIMIGAGTTLSTLSLQRLVVPVDTSAGCIELHLAAKERPHPQPPLPDG